SGSGRGRRGPGGARDDERRARHRVRDDHRLQAEDLADEFGRDDVPGGALRDDPALLHGDQAVRVPGRLVEVVQHGDDRTAPGAVRGRGRQLSYQVQDFDLVGDVQI